jgi:8-oxo-dGTP pyrophosphatase MutT (NUDIX family)
VPSKLGVSPLRYQDDEPLDPEREGLLSYWVPPGGALEPGESYRSAARRELEEESGLLPEIGPEIWVVEHRLRFHGQLVNQRERYFIGRVNAVRPAVANRTADAIKKLETEPFLKQMADWVIILVRSEVALLPWPLWRMYPDWGLSFLPSRP